MGIVRFRFSRVLACLWLAGSLCAIAPAQSTPASIPAPPPDKSTFARPIPANRGAAALEESLRKLRTRASLIMITAHPDDEDGGLLAYESRYAGADTSLLTLNRGEGGQNVMSANYWDELGLLRTEELLSADRYYGVHQYWSRVADFGFSKSLDESLQTWGHDRVLYDVVRVIRMTRPLVVTSVFAGNVSDGHGQHQVAGEMAQEAFRAAGDPKVFPDQIRAGLRPWSPLRVYARVPFARVSSRGIYDSATGLWAPARFRNYVKNTWIEGMPSATLMIPEGQYDPVIGLSYLQLAREGWSEQKSQNGGGGLPLPGPVSTPYHLYASLGPAPAAQGNFFDGIDVSLEGIADEAPAADQAQWRTRLAPLSATVDKAWNAFTASEPWKIAPMLADGLAQTNQLLAELAQSHLPAAARYNMTFELTVKQRQFNQALIEALGLNVVSLAGPQPNSRFGGGGGGNAESFQIAIPGQQFEVAIHIADQGKEPVLLHGATLDPSGSNRDKAAGPSWKMVPQEDSANAGAGILIAAGQTLTLPFSVTVPPHAAFTRPYFSRPTVEQSYYDIDDPKYLNLSTSPYPLTARLTFEYHGVELHTADVVQTSHRVTGQGTILQPLLTGPAISLWLSPDAGIVPLNSTALHLEVTLHNYVKGPAKGTLHLQLPTGWTSNPEVANWAAEHSGDEQTIAFDIHPQGVRAQHYTIKAVAGYQGQSYSQGLQMLGYRGLRPYPYYRAATYRTTGVNVRVPSGLKVGYIMGSGDEVPSSLQDLGIHVSLLSPQDLETGNLSGYDVIVVGIRAYAVRPELATENGRLLDYVKNGGVLLVQYQTPEFDHDYGPYPLSLGRSPEKVVEEHAPVTYNAADPLFTWPNKIDQADFTGWVEEWGHDFLNHWDPKYVAPTEVHDQGQQPQHGGLVYARYGRGLYVYTAFAFYRQLPEGVPGAFRIFANLLSLSKNPAFAAK